MPPGIGYPLPPTASDADLLAALFGGAPANVAAPPPALLQRTRPVDKKHAAEMARSRAYVNALDAASLSGERGVREAQYDEITERFPEKGMPVGTTLVGGGDMDHVPRRKVPSGSLGAISARIAGLGTPFDMPAQPEAVPDFVGRKSDPSELGRRTSQLLAMRENPQYQATLDARKQREDQIAANMQARRESQYIDPNGGVGQYEMAPAALSLLMRRNPQLAVQVQQQQADRAARSRDEESLADYRGGQLSVARGELAQRRRDAQADRESNERIAGMQASGRDRDLIAEQGFDAIVKGLQADLASGMISREEYDQKVREAEGRARGAPVPQPQASTGSPAGVSFANRAATAVRAAADPGVKFWAPEGGIEAMSIDAIGKRLFESLDPEDESAGPDQRTIDRIADFVRIQAEKNPQWAAAVPASQKHSRAQQAGMEMIDAILKRKDWNRGTLRGLKWQFNARKEREAADTQRRAMENRELASPL